jgi:nucleoid-associated protein YgaU
VVSVGPRWYTFDQTFNRTLFEEPGAVKEAVMSVATELVPSVSIPVPARPARPVERERWATVSVLRPPADAPQAPPLRLTRRGVVVLTALVVVLGITLVWLARSSAPRAADPAGAGPRTVTVAPGDTLWSIASRVAPDQDPRAEVAALQQRNHLAGAELTPGQVLRIR